jgi:hypothetical protein
VANWSEVGIVLCVGAKLLRQVDRLPEVLNRVGRPVASSSMYDAGGSGSLATASGWHHHPGVVLAVVKSGQFKFYEDLGKKKKGCSVRTLNPGDVFVESGKTPGNLRNETASPAVVDATFVAPHRTPGPVLRVEDSVRCGVDP